MFEQDKQDHYLVPLGAKAEQSSLADLLQRSRVILIRQRKVMAIVFVGIMLGAILAGLSRPVQYEASMKLLLLHNRVQPSVSTDVNSVAQLPQISDEELNSEVELLKSRGVLVDVVRSCDLQNHNHRGIRARIIGFFGGGSGAKSSKEESLSLAVAALARALNVRTMKVTDIIEVTYTSDDPDLSVKVLQALAAAYLKKHLEVHQIPGALDFFTQETQRYHDELTRATARLSGFTSQYGIGSAADERDQTVAKLVGFEADMRQAQANVHDKQNRILTLKSELQTTPGRIQTQARFSDNVQLLEEMQSSLLQKELERSKLATTFNSSYAPLRELNTEIAQIRDAIASQRKTPVTEQTSDASPAHTYLAQELVRTQADLASQSAQASALANIVQNYRNKISSLEQRTIEERDLNRDVQTSEANYLLYQHKLEESRISDALDRKNIANVSVVENPTKPERPSNLGLLLIGAIGLIIATLVSVGSAFVVDGFATTFRTSEEVEELLGVPVLALMPETQ